MRATTTRGVEAAAIVAALIAAGPAASQAPFPPELPALAAASRGDETPRLPASVTATRSDDGRWACLIRFEGDPSVDSVHLAGDFNHWSPTATPMRRLGSLWIAEIELPDGVHGYKFVATDREGRVRWLDDPRNDRRSPDGHGGFNSLLPLGPEARLFGRTLQARRGDGSIEAVAVRHDARLPIYRQAVEDGEVLRLRTLRDDVESIELLVEHGEGVEAIAMAEILDDDRFTWWEATLPG
ncbi:MAG: hypothetical protein ACO3ZY_08440, partial [Phycisphaerales bacterium]